MTSRVYSENDIADAILAITEDGLSQKQAAEKHGIPRSTLQSRMNGQGAVTDQIQPGKRLTSNKKIRIRDWALRQESLGYGLSHSQIRAGVEALLKQRGDNTPLGVNWVSRLAKKYPELKAKKERIQESVRFNAFTPKAVNWYFDILEDYSWIKPDNIVNVDKGGIMSGYDEFN
jgi:hypothetical protein